MPMYLRSLLLTAGILLAAPHAIARGECDKFNTSYDKTYCFSKLFVESDKELNAVCSERAKTGLTEVQRDWIKYRDQICQPQAGSIAVDCNYEVNRLRAEYLRDRLRECKAGACRDDMIARKNWD